MADRMNAVDEESLTESSSEEDQCSTGDRRRTTPPYYYAKTESLQVHTQLATPCNNHELAVGACEQAMHDVDCYVVFMML